LAQELKKKLTLLREFTYRSDSCLTNALIFSLQEKENVRDALLDGHDKVGWKVEIKSSTGIMRDQ
jgi:hypothetical protein